MITTLSGPNSFALRQELDKKTTEFIENYGDFAVEKIDGEEAEMERIGEALNNLPFLASKKLVILRSPGQNKLFAEKAPDLLANISDSTDVILVEPKLDKRGSYAKFLQKQTDFKNFNELDSVALVSWLTEQAKSSGGKLSSADAQYLIERAGANQQLLSQELVKLLTYNPEITRENIDLLTELTPQSTIFQLLDAAFSGDTKKALSLYEEQRQQKVEPLNILGLIIWQLNILAIVKTAGQRSTDEIAREASLNPYIVRKSQAICQKMSLAELKKLIREVLELDIKLKTTSINADDALKQLIITITI